MARAKRLLTIIHRMQKTCVLTCWIAAQLLFAHAAVAEVAARLKLPRRFTNPVWMSSRSIDIVLDFKEADPGYQTSGLPLHKVIRGENCSLRYHLGWSYGNTAITRFGTQFILAVRKSAWAAIDRSELPVVYPKTHMNSKKGDRVLLWESATLLCSVNPGTLQPTSCVDFDPRDWQEAWWGTGFEATGVEDPRLFVWPGKGLYAMFGSKGPPINPDAGFSDFPGMLSDGPLAFQQWLVLLQPYEEQPDPMDPWAQGIVRLTYVDDTNNTASDGLRREKNWNPFIYKGKLYFSQSFWPHVVLRPFPDGTCVKLYETWSPLLSVFSKNKPRGNTPAVLVPAGFTGEPLDYYLGIIHVEKNRAYLSFFYKMLARPPFTIYSLSRAIPLIGGQHPWNRDWHNMSFPMSLEVLPDAHQVLIGYGSGDSVPHIKGMAFSAVQQLFPFTAQEELSMLAGMLRPS